METVPNDRFEEGSSTENLNLSEDLHESQLRDDDLRFDELVALRVSYQELQARFELLEDNVVGIQQQRDEAMEQSLELGKELEEISIERDYLRSEIREVKISAREREHELIKQVDDESREKSDFRNKFEASQERVAELGEEVSERIGLVSKNLGLVVSVKECLLRIMETMGEEKVVEEGGEMEEYNLGEDLNRFILEMKVVDKLVKRVEMRLKEHEEMKRKEIRELENSVASLTEENRDINSLLRVALVEKEAVEKALNKLKGSGEQKRVPLLQFGLQKVGFGFMMSNSAGDSPDNLGSNMSSKSDSSQCEEEVVTLASTVEKMMKNLRLEITQLRLSLEESRSDIDRLQSLSEKQAREIAEMASYIKDSEERESMLKHNVEQLMIEIADAEEDISRWRQACELEVEAGKNAIAERDREAAILREELEHTKASLNMLSSKVKLKEELAVTAMAAQKAIEKSLQLADNRAAGLRERIEELTKQLEEAENRGERSNRHRVRHICWPWKALKVNPSGPRSRNARRMLPEMESLLHITI